MKRKTQKRIIAGLLALCLATILPCGALADTISEVKERQTQLEEERQKLEDRLESLKGDEAEKAAYQETLAEQIGVVERQVNQTREDIDSLNYSIKELTLKLEKSQESIDDTVQQFKQRLVALYKGGSVSTLEILLTSDSLSEFSYRVELLKTMDKQDKKLLEKIEEYMEKTRDNREECRAQMEEVAELKKGLEEKQEKLDGLYEENEAALTELRSAKANTEEAIVANEKEDEALQARLEELIRQRTEEEEKRKEQAGQGVIIDPPSPGMHEDFSPCWPLPGIGLSNITGHYGDMYPNGPHNGLDIGAGYGTPIVAAQAGQVLSAEYHNSWGNNVLIWHNGTFSTRYAHMSSIAVSPGQYVEQGQTIGYVGSTGNSEGNHLHFEVYYQGVRVNPDPYLGI